MKSTMLLCASALLLASSVEAQEAHLNIGINVGYLIAGDSLVKGGPANPTGGTTIVPFARASVAVPGLDWLDVVYTQSPMLVTPFSIDDVGLVDANDIGVSFYMANRALSATISGTAAPSYMTFCNVQWCLKESLVMWGAEAHVTAKVSSDASGRGLEFNIASRIFHAQPTAWTWSKLSPEDRKVIPTIVMFSGGAEWSW